MWQGIPLTSRDVEVIRAAVRDDFAAAAARKQAAKEAKWGKSPWSNSAAKVYGGAAASALLAAGLSYVAAGECEAPRSAVECVWVMC